MSRASRRLRRESSYRAHNASTVTEATQNKYSSIYFGNSKANVDSLRKKMQQDK